jgi:hypothetical protein
MISKKIIRLRAACKIFVKQGYSVTLQKLKSPFDDMDVSINISYF